ncbi:MAG: hypothetical protein R3F43_12095 [bacterium]
MTSPPSATCCAPVRGRGPGGGRGRRRRRADSPAQERHRPRHRAICACRAWTAWPCSTLLALPRAPPRHPVAGSERAAVGYERGATDYFIGQRDNDGGARGAPDAGVERASRTRTAGCAPSSRCPA